MTDPHAELIDGGKDERDAASPYLITGHRLTYRDLALLDALVHQEGKWAQVAAVIGRTERAVKQQCFYIARKLALPDASWWRLAFYRCKMLGAIEHYAGTRDASGWPLRDLFRPDARKLGPEHPFYELLHPLRKPTRPDGPTHDAAASPQGAARARRRRRSEDQTRNSGPLGSSG